MGKDNFILYSSHKELFETLPDGQAGKLIKAIFQYEETGEIPKLNSATQMAFVAIKSTLDRNKEKYEKTVERNKQNGKKGGRPKTQNNPENPVGFFETQENPKKPKKADNDNDSDNENEKDNDVEYKKIIQAYEENIGTIAPASAELLLSYLDSLSAEMIVQAIKIATQRNKRNARYIQGILNDWVRKGYKVLADIEQEKKLEKMTVDDAKKYGINSFDEIYEN